MGPLFTKAVRAPKSRGKWHLIFSRTRTVCWLFVGGDWTHVDRSSLDPNRVCANCLRDTP